MKKNVLFGIAALVLAAAFVMTGCSSPTSSSPGAGNGNDNGNLTNNDTFAGTWTGTNSDGSLHTIVAANGSFKEFKNSIEIIRGTYTVSGNTVNVKLTSVNTKTFSGGADAWVSYSSLTDSQKQNIGGSDTQTMTISGSSFTVKGVTFTKATGNNSDIFAGTWEGTSNGAKYTIVAASGSFKEFRNSIEIIRGTYTVSGNTVTGKLTSVNTIMFNGGDNAWVSYSSLTDSQKQNVGSETQTKTISGNSYNAGNGLILTKKSP